MGGPQTGNSKPWGIQYPEARSPKLHLLHLCHDNASTRVCIHVYTSAFAHRVILTYKDIVPLRALIHTLCTDPSAPSSSPTIAFSAAF